MSLKFGPIAIALGLCLCLLPGFTPLHAWSPKGHMVVAYLAYQKLDKPVRERADFLLTLNPFFKRWVSMIPPTVAKKDRSLATFMIAATWADQIKSAGTYSDDGTHNGNVPNGPSSSQNTGYDDKLRHKYWHFVDIPFSFSSLPLPALLTPNAQERITLFLSVLKGSSPDPLKSYDLTWLLHIIGDVHQPLHAATRITKGDLDGDDGGNGVKIGCGSMCETKLHSVWDGLMGTSEDVSVAMSTAMGMPAADPTLAAILDESVWITESFELAKNVAYAKPVGPGLGPFTLSPAYNTNARNTGRAQAALAGARLAAVLNRDLK